MTYFIGVMHAVQTGVGKALLQGKFCYPEPEFDLATDTMRLT